MKKIKESVISKILACVILAVSLLTTFISFFVVIEFYENGVYNPGGKEQAEDLVVQGLVENYNCEALSYYSILMEKEIYDNDGVDTSLDFYEDYFKEENTNYFFSIEPIGEYEGLYPSLSNYEENDFRYSATNYHDYDVYPEASVYIYSIGKQCVMPDKTLEEIYTYEPGAYYIDIYESTTEVANDNSTIEVYDDSSIELYDESTTEVWTYYEEYDIVEQEVTEENPDIYIEYEYINFTEDGRYEMSQGSDGIHYLYDGYTDTRIVLEELPGFKEGYAKFEKEIQDKFEVCDETIYFIPNTMEYAIVATGCDYVSLKITSGVKNTLTARDEFYSSFWVNNISFIVEASIPALVISVLLLILSFSFIVVSAGHWKNEEGITLTWFDKLPYDILLGIFIFAICVIWNMGSYLYFDDTVEIVIMLLALFSLGVCGAVGLYTTVARIKAKVFFRYTFIYIFGKWILKWIKYFWRNLNIYWKYLGVFVIVTILELILATVTYNLGMVLTLVFIEKAVSAVILAIGVINMNSLKKAAVEIADGNTAYEVDTEKMLWEFKKHGENLNSIKDGISLAVEERMKSERLKTELITNVSHDIKTPLTSIISYVDLLSKEELENEKAKEYIEVLDRQSARLKKLIQDLIDASKASTGNIPVEITTLDSKVLLEQALGEYSEKLEQKGLKVMVGCKKENTMVRADGKLLWRTFDNIVGNIVKYTQDSTRVYVDIEEADGYADEASSDKVKKMLKISFKNISKDELNVSGDELMERFVRGDSSRNTEGSGLGLSIAKSLMEIQGGELKIVVDGDLFKVVLLIATA